MKGHVSVEWKTQESQSAVSDKDFRVDVGIVTMVDGETGKKINIQIINNGKAELMKTFEIVLKNPTGGGR